VQKRVSLKLSRCADLFSNAGNAIRAHACEYQRSLCGREFEFVKWIAIMEHIRRLIKYHLDGASVLILLACNLLFSRSLNAITSNGDSPLTRLSLRDEPFNRDRAYGSFDRCNWKSRETMNALRRVETARGAHRRPNRALD